MELHQLRYFCAVADTGSFSRAAEHSHVAQPSLSQQILKLEDELGARLFDRLGRSVRLTDVGKAFLPRARAVLRELAAAKGDVVERKGSVAGSLTVGVIPTIAPYYLPPKLSSFTRQFPQARVTVVEEITPVLLDRLRASAVDAYSHGYHVVLAEECCFDRSILSHKVNLFDLHHKYADVMHVDEVVAHLAKSPAVKKAS